MATRGWDGVTNADLARLRAQSNKEPKPSKYKNVKVVVDGEKFDSKKEAAYWVELKMRAKVGEIFNLQRQVAIPLYCFACSPHGQPMAVEVATYVADFTFHTRDSPLLHIVDVKGQKKRACPYPLKKKWLELQEGFIITEV